MEWTKKCGERLRELRKDREMSQEDLARATGRSVVTISRWERCSEGSPKFRGVTELAVALEVSAPYLLCETDDPQGYGKLGPHPKQLTRAEKERRQRRDLFAAVAMFGLLSRGREFRTDIISEDSFKIADAMMEASK